MIKTNKTAVVQIKFSPCKVANATINPSSSSYYKNKKTPISSKLKHIPALVSALTDICYTSITSTVLWKGKCGGDVKKPHCQIHVKNNDKLQIMEL